MFRFAGMYYLRTRPAVDAIKFTVDQEMLRKEEAAAKAAKAADEFKFSSFGSPVMSPVAFEKKSMGSFELARAGAASPFEATRSDSPATLRECFCLVGCGMSSPLWLHGCSWLLCSELVC